MIPRRVQKGLGYVRRSHGWNELLQFYVNRTVRLKSASLPVRQSYADELHCVAAAALWLAHHNDSKHKSASYPTSSFRLLHAVCQLSSFGVSVLAEHGKADWHDTQVVRLMRVAFLGCALAGVESTLSRSQQRAFVARTIRSMTNVVIGCSCDLSQAQTAWPRPEKVVHFCSLLSAFLELQPCTKLPGKPVKIGNQDGARSMFTDAVFSFRMVLCARARLHPAYNGIDITCKGLEALFASVCYELLILTPPRTKCNLSTSPVLQAARATVSPACVILAKSSYRSVHNKLSALAMTPCDFETGSPLQKMHLLVSGVAVVRYAERTVLLHYPIELIHLRGVFDLISKIMRMDRITTHLLAKSPVVTVLLERIAQWLTTEKISRSSLPGRTAVNIHTSWKIAAASSRDSPIRVWLKPLVALCKYMNNEWF